MRLYYPVLLVAAVAIATTNVCADGADEERMFKGLFSRGSSSKSVKNDVVKSAIEIFEADYENLAQIIQSGKYETYVALINDATNERLPSGKFKTVHGYLRDRYTDKEMLQAIHVVNYRDDFIYGLMNEWITANKPLSFVQDIEQKYVEELKKKLGKEIAKEWTVDLAARYEDLIKKRISSVKNDDLKKFKLLQLELLLDSPKEQPKKYIPSANKNARRGHY